MLSGLVPISTRVILGRDALLHAIDIAGPKSTLSIGGTKPIPNATSSPADAQPTPSSATAAIGPVTGTADTASPRPVRPEIIAIRHPDGTAVGQLTASVAGAAVTVTFDRTTLRPAVCGAVGPDIMLDISGPTDPVLIRSASDGDLTTLAMPTFTTTHENQGIR